MPVRVGTIYDWPAIQAHHAAQNQRDGTDYALTPLFDPQTGELMPNIVLVLVRHTGNRIDGCVYFEMCAEMLFAGGDAEATAELASHIDEAAYILRGRGIESLHCQVPREHLPDTRRCGPIERLLKWVGFKRDDQRLGHFFKDLRDRP